MRDGTQIPKLDRIVRKDGRSVDEQYQFQETNMLSTEWWSGMTRRTLESTMTKMKT